MLEVVKTHVDQFPSFPSHWPELSTTKGAAICELLLMMRTEAYAGRGWKVMKDEMYTFRPSARQFVLEWRATAFVSSMRYGGMAFAPLARVMFRPPTGGGQNATHKHVHIKQVPGPTSVRE